MIRRHGMMETIYHVSQIVSPVLKPGLRMMISEIRIGGIGDIRYLCYYFTGDDIVKEAVMGEAEIEAAE
tara:strand:+ start:711 stop:917 length:207 start_codon:yes stop_codon:yes gene_type:complete